MAFESYVVKTLEELDRVIKDLPDDMKVEIAEGAGITPETVGELRALSRYFRLDDSASLFRESATPRPW
jgi:hypothetical protein